jgi:flagellar basal body-associated protein FliL
MVHLKKSSSSRRSYETSGLKRFMIVLLIIIACTAVLGLFWFLSQFGPKEVDYSARTAAVEISVEATALREQSVEVEAQFEEVLAMRQAEPQDMLLLKRALDIICRQRNA